MLIQTKRIYEPASNDGFRILTDRIWPRGISKEKRASTGGQRIWRRRHGCAGGFIRTATGRLLNVITFWN